MKRVLETHGTLKQIARVCHWNSGGRGDRSMRKGLFGKTMAGNYSTAVKNINLKI